MENIIVTASNLYAIYPTLGYASLELWPQCYAVVFSAIASIIYHLFEHQKHNMPGMCILKDKRSHNILINIDRFAAIFVTIICLFQVDWIKLNYNTFFMISICALLSGSISEYFSKFLTKSGEKWIHVVFHSI